MNNSNFYKVDNVSRVFLATHNLRDTRSLRVSATLNEEIDPEMLQKAVDKAARRNPQFQVRIRRGLFWHYMEDTDVTPVVVKENDRPCPVLYGEHYRGVLHYKVSYWDNRINLDMFHAIGDGTGALEYLDNIVLNYLKLKYNEEMEGLTVGKGSSLDERRQDSYSQFSDKGSTFDNIPKVADSCQVGERKLPYNQLQFFEIRLEAKDILARSKELGVSLTSYIGSELMMAVHKTMPTRQSRRPVTISLPVNLRNYYPSETSRNFFNSVQISHSFDGTETVESLSREFDKLLKERLNPETVKQNMNNYQQIERNVVARVAPLFIKQPVVKFFTKRESKAVTAVLSNLGVRKPAEPIAARVMSYSAFCSTESVFITVHSYKDELVLGVASAFQRTGYLKELVKRLNISGNGTVYATTVVK